MPIAFNTLSNFPIFRELSPQDIEPILLESQVRQAPAQAHLIQAHQQPSHVLIILRGQFQLVDVAEDGRIIHLSFANPGDTIGLLSMIDGKPILSNVITVCATEFAQIPIATARRVFLGNPTISERIMHSLVSSVRRSVEERRLLSLPNAFQRVFAQIASIAKNTSPEDNISTQLPKQHDLAIMVNTSRETVSRALQLLIKKGVLLKNGHKIQILQPAQLVKLAHDGANIQSEDEKSSKKR